MAKRDKESKKTISQDQTPADPEVELKVAKKTIRRLEKAAGSAQGNALDMAKIKVIIDHHLEDFDIDLEAELPFVVGLSLDDDGEVTGESSYRPAVAKAEAEGDEGDEGDDPEGDDGDAEADPEEPTTAAKKVAKQTRRVKVKVKGDARKQANDFFARRSGLEPTAEK